MFETVYIMSLICLSLLIFMIQSFLVSLVYYCAYYYTTSNSPTKEEHKKITEEHKVIINAYNKMYFNIYLFTMSVYFYMYFYY